MNEIVNNHLLKVNRLSREVLEQVISESQTYGDAKENLNELKILAKSHYKTEHLATIYDQALLELEEKINATLIKK
ncbi:transcriptional regulator [Staphylococcus saprophyticus]|uniref:transcriptional regulator n=1 Tax=Staphylococcus saprophyticus TaxID=29385 RepID=UPI0010121E94|nr:transcriptional regulator [Staphylococcus saprophyticus]MDW3910684.1 transcriptional regulator [Staphylococcus saprophyticus]MDW4471140.1 transcriptional regulator [Staphylococcus saprophyticus]MEB7998878.1 transcriptional regulator [Staphylococcus saprophyticus]RXS10147.1 transcriptional regulator [Staphylococcus saprophyticus]